MAKTNGEIFQNAIDELHDSGEQLASIARALVRLGLKELANEIGDIGADVANNAKAARDAWSRDLREWEERWEASPAYFNSESERLRTALLDAHQKLEDACHTGDFKLVDDVRWRLRERLGITNN